MENKLFNETNGQPGYSTPPPSYDEIVHQNQPSAPEPAPELPSVLYNVPSAIQTQPQTSQQGRQEPKIIIVHAVHPQQGGCPCAFVCSNCNKQKINKVRKENCWKTCLPCIISCTLCYAMMCLCTA